MKIRETATDRTPAHIRKTQGDFVGAGISVGISWGFVIGFALSRAFDSVWFVAGFAVTMYLRGVWKAWYYGEKFVDDNNF